MYEIPAYIPLSLWLVSVLGFGPARPPGSDVKPRNQTERNALRRAGRWLRLTRVASTRGKVAAVDTAALSRIAPAAAEALQAEAAQAMAEGREPLWGVVRYAHLGRWRKGSAPSAKRSDVQPRAARSLAREALDYEGS